MGIQGVCLGEGTPPVPYGVKFETEFEIPDPNLLYGCDY